MRSLRSEYRVKRAGAFPFTLELEEFAQKTLAAKHGIEFSTAVAETLGVGSDGTWRLAPLKGPRDYSRSNSRGTRRVFRVFVLWEGPIYQVREHLGFTKHREFFLRRWNGQSYEMTPQEVAACLEK